jgi:7-cyano-7-deazaguanine synthase
MRGNPPPATGLLFSGGFDSAVLLDQLLANGRSVVPVYVRMRCAWEECELAAAKQFLRAVARPNLSRLVVLNMPLDDLYAGHWSMTGVDVPDQASPDEAVYLFGRNPLMLIKPALWCVQHGIERLALATLAGNPFDDAKPEFFAHFSQMLHAATGRQLEITRPFCQLSKRRLMELGRHLPLQLTFSCLSPVDGLHCGRCNKCAERRKAFADLGIADPTAYFDSVPRSAPGTLLGSERR